MVRRWVSDIDRFDWEMSIKFSRLAGIYCICFDSNHTEISNFYPLEVVDCSSMTQL